MERKKRRERRTRRTRRERRRYPAVCAVCAVCAAVPLMIRKGMKQAVNQGGDAHGLAVLFSGCLDSQCSADCVITYHDPNTGKSAVCTHTHTHTHTCTCTCKELISQSEARGALTSSLIRSIEESNFSPTYDGLLMSMRQKIVQSGSKIQQIPQLSFNHESSSLLSFSQSDGFFFC